MTNYTKTTDFAAKDALPSGNSAKIVKGSEIDTEFNNIATASATKANANDAALTGTTTFETISDGTIAITAFVDEDNMASDSATLVPTQQSVKAYVDSQVTAQDLDFQADSGGALSIDLDSETLTFTGGTGVDTSGSGNAVTFAIDSTVATLTGTQTLSNKTLSAPTVSGNLTTDGLIDGRDVATDGTKLDGIEALADVTDTTNVTAAGALMDSELTDIAAVKALDQGVATTDSPTFAGLTTTADVSFGDDDKAVFGAGSDLQIYHDGSNSYISDQGTGNLRILAEDFRVVNAANSETMIQANVDGDVRLYHDADLKLATTSTGIDVTGVITTDGMTTSADINFGDNDKAVFGAGSDLQIYHDGSHSFIKDAGTGHLKIQATNLKLQDVDGNNYIDCIDGSYVRIMHNTATKLETTATGIDVTGVITTDGMTTSADINFGDNDKAIFGAGSDLQIYHDGSNSYISDVGTGSLIIDGSSSTQIKGSSFVILRSSAGENMAVGNADGSFDLYHNGAKKLATTSTGIDVTGSVTADGLQLDAANSEAIIGANASYQGKIKYNDGTGELEFRNTFDSSLRGYAFYRGSTDKTALRLDGNGDISFYEDTGTTAKLFWDASAESLGIGTTAPERKLHVDSAGVQIGALISSTSTLSSRLSLMDANTTSSSKVGIGATGDTLGLYAGGSSKVTVDASGNVGIGTDSPSKKLVISDGGAMGVEISPDDSGNGYSRIINYDRTTNQYEPLRIEGEILQFSTGTTATEKARLDASGNLLVGKSSSSFTTAGVELAQGGTAGKVQIQRSSSPLSLVNLTDDGSILNFYKGTGAVGSIGVNSDRIYLSGASEGVYIDTSLSAFSPCTTSGGNFDDHVDLGGSSSRFKDLYLSGGAYLGGTGSANKLDDYEEGTYAATLTPSTSGSITLNTSFDTLSYTKVGRIVSIVGRVRVSSVSSPVGTYVRLSLPFNIATGSEDDSRVAGAVVVQQAAQDIDKYCIHPKNGTSYIEIGRTDNFTSNAANDFSGDELVAVNFTYITTA